MLTALENTLSPFLWGGALALFLNLPLGLAERAMARMPKKLRRALALAAVLAALCALLGLGAWLLVPQLLAALSDLSAAAARLPGLLETVAGRAAGTAGETLLRTAAKSMAQLKIEAPDVSALVGAGMDAAMQAAGAAGRFFVALVLAVYLLADKENLARRSRLLARALFGAPRAEALAVLCRRAGGVFAGFIAGQCIEAGILAGLFVLALFVFRMPYVLPVAAVIGVTALVPVFGAWAGGAVGFLLVFSAAPEKAGWFLVLFLIVQQFENNCIYPRVVGGRIGLPPLWVLAAVLLGGGLFGVAGLLLGIPAMSVVYHVGGEWARRAGARPEEKGESGSEKQKNV